MCSPFSDFQTTNQRLEHKAGRFVYFTDVTLHYLMAIRLQSENGPATCIIDCEGAGRGFSLWQGETAGTIIDGFTIINGNEGYSGGIYAANSSPTIRNCVISGCAAEYGAGTTLSVSDATITNCTIVQNASNIGPGGIFLYDSDTAITHCTIADNTAASGGGIFCIDSSPTVTNTIFWDNTATYGAEILIDIFSTLTINNSDVEWGQLYAYVGYDSYLVWDLSNATSNPLFVGGGNYHLSASSPLHRRRNRRGSIYRHRRRHPAQRSGLREGIGRILLAGPLRRNARKRDRVRPLLHSS